jgi:hypothetical protein
LFTGCPWPNKTSENEQPSVVPSVPAVPANVTAIAQGSNSIVISWNGQSDVTGYRVYRDEITGTFTNCISGATPWNGTQYLDTGLEANKNYYYKVSAVNAKGESEKSAIATTKTGESVVNSGIDYTSYETNFAFLVKNLSNEKLVAFKSNLQESNIIGGIPAGASSHAIKNDPSKFTKSEGFTLTLLTEDQYIANKTNLGNPALVPFARIFIFFNKNGTNEKIYEIYSRTMGRFIIQLNSGKYSNMNIELRRNGIDGIPIGFNPQGMAFSKIYVDQGDYQLFPVFIKYNELRDEVITVYPKFPDGTACQDLMSLYSDHPEANFDIEKLLTSEYKFSTGTAHLIIDNQSGAGILLRRGDTTILTSEGIAGIPSGLSRRFPIFMEKIGDNKYEPSQSIQSYGIGQLGTTPKPIGNYSLNVDTVYKVTVTGTNISNLQISAPVEIGTVDLSDF